MSRFVVAILLVAPAAGAVPRRRPAPEPPPVKLSLDAAEDRDHVVFSLVNESASPVRILANRFLLGLEIRPEKGRGGVRRCNPPQGLAPRGVSPERIVPLAPGERYDERIDVRFLCWGQTKLRAKAHTLKASYGKRGRASADRWVVSNADGTGGRFARLESEPLLVAALPEASATKAPRRGLQLSASNVTSFDGREVIVGLRLKNHGPDPVDVFLHPFTYRFRVSSAAGETICAMHDPVRSLTRDRFTRIRRNGVQTARLDMAAFCPRDTFAAAGAYEVRPEVVFAEDGASVGLTAFTGTVAAEPILVRITQGHTGRYVRTAGR